MDQDNKLVPLAKKMTPSQLEQLASLARGQVLQPFAGARALDAMQEARSKLEQGMGGLKKAGSWVKDSKVSQFTMGKIGQLAEFSKEKAAQSAGESRIGQALSKLNDQTKGLQELAKKGGQAAQEKIWQAVKDYTAQGFSLLVYEDTQSWIMERAGKLLEREIMGRRDIQTLTLEERQQLITALYPYDSPNLKQWIRGFDGSFNVALGAIAASQLPGTGVLVAAVNLTKTMIKAANRITIISAVYGFHIQSPEALFRFTGRVLENLADWEQNPDHRPLDPADLKDLYAAPSETGGQAFSDLVSEAFKKEAYIAIPGVGAISIGKIHLDDLKLDLAILHLVQNYYYLTQLREELAEKDLKTGLEALRQIQQGLWQGGFAKKAKAGLSEEKEKLTEKLQNLASGRELAPLHALLQEKALEIFTTLQTIDSKDLERAMAQEVEKCLEGL